MTNLAGITIGQYQIIEEIGRGGMATVYRAHQPSMGRDVAIKMLHRSLLEQDPAFLERFRREAQVVAKLQHPHILPVYDFGEHEGQPYLVMAMLGGGSLSDRIKQDGAMSIMEVIRVLRPLAEALDFAHEQEIIHRDFKPANVMFDGHGNVYLSDFGLARMGDSSQLTASAGMVGTPDYMAPDWGKADGVTHAVDIYALGVTLYQMLVGHVPYRASTPMGVLMAHSSEPIPNIMAERDDLPDGIQDIINAAIAKKAEDRFPTATALTDGLNALVTMTTPTSSQSLPPPPPAAPATEDAHYPNSWGLMLLRILEELLGPNDLVGVLIQADAEHLIGSLPADNMQREFSLKTISRILNSIRLVLGDEEALPILNQLGRRSHAESVKFNRIVIKVWEVASRMVSTEMRVWLGLEAAARVFNSASDQRVELENHDDHWIWRNVANCPDCIDEEHSRPPCEWPRSYLEAAGEFASGGGKYRVTEIACHAAGDDACTFRIDKTPLE